MQIIELFVRNSLEDTVHVLELDGILDMCMRVSKFISSPVSLLSVMVSYIMFWITCEPRMSKHVCELLIYKPENVLLALGLMTPDWKLGSSVRLVDSSSIIRSVYMALKREENTCLFTCFIRS